MTKCVVEKGQVYRDLHPHRQGREIFVLWAVKNVALVRSNRRYTTLVDVDRIANPSRFQRVP